MLKQLTYMQCSFNKILKPQVLCVVVFLFVISSSCVAQKADIIYASHDLDLLTGNSKISKITYGPLSSSIKIKFSDGSVKRVNKDAIWGYIDTNGDIYRQYNKDFFKVVNRSFLIKYTKVNLHSQGARYPRPLVEAFFSKTLDSKIHSDSLAVLLGN